MEQILILRKKNIQAAACSAGFLCILLALLFYPRQVRENVAGSAGYCIGVLIPSLFPFMALASYAVNSPAAAFLGRPLDGLTRRVFRLPGCCAVPILMSFLGGYPAGARGISLLLERGEINREQAGRMLLFCVNPGLAFTVTFLGSGIFGSTRLGWLLFFSVTLSGLLLGVITAFRAPVPPRGESFHGAPTSSALMRSVTDSSKSVLVMCACIMLFSGLTAILHGSGIFQAILRLTARTRLFSPMEWAVVLSFLLEVTGGVGDASRLSAAPVFYAFGLAFGGLCVHMQVFAFFDQLPTKFWRFWLCRLVHGLMASGCFLIACRFLPRDIISTSAPLAGTAAGALSGSLLGGASLLLMCVAFLLITGKGKKFDGKPT